MGGFTRGLLNDVIRKDIFVSMRNFVIACCGLMTDESVNEENYLPNHEEKIRNRLLFRYLRNTSVRRRLGYNDLELIFVSETAENYNHDSDTANARLDIQVMSEDTFKFPEKYYTIECKRIDGYARLNREYVNQGVARFVSHDAKYQSVYKKNMMLGFMVRRVDMKLNAEKINNIQSDEFAKEIKKEMHLTGETAQYCVYEANYLSPFGEIQLHHIFYDVSIAIQPTEARM